MRATIVYDNTSSRQELQADWGFACYIETADSRILFDTGARGNILLANLRQLGIEPVDVDEIFISHDHWDHTGGLAAFLEQNRDVKIYLPQALSEPVQAREVICNAPATQIGAGVYTTGVLEEIEQSLVVKTSRGLLLFAGCSHPSMSKILTAASQYGKLYGIIGGLHGFDNYDLLADLLLICPTHCTQHQNEIKAIYPQQYQQGGAGVVLEIE